MRPSKFRLPDSTDATTRSQSSMAAEISGASGPEFPMQVVQPYPTRLNLSWSRYGVSPASRRYSVTTLDPGASDAFTQGLVDSPRSTAFFATRPAATITDGFEVFVQLVIAAMTTHPWVRWPLWSPRNAAEGAVGSSTPTAVPPPPSLSRRISLLTSVPPPSTIGSDFALVGGAVLVSSIIASDFSQSALASCSVTRSCGRFGPARLGSTVDRSSSSVS